MRENRLRRMAARQRLVLRKSRRRDPYALDYGSYWLVSFNNTLEAGDEFGWSLDDIERYLKGELTEEEGELDE
ncbi:MAG: hypothetical protein WKF65_02320 [Gaiellaceae bacterium]